MITIFLATNVLRFFRKDVIQLVNHTLQFQGDVVEMMRNLEEAILTRSSKGIGFCNNLGIKIMQEIIAARTTLDSNTDFRKNLNDFKPDNYKDLDFGVFHDIRDSDRQD